MKKNNTLWLLLLALCSIFAACKKDHPSKTELEKLPPATQTGANTFGCLLNGNLYIPGGGGVFENVLSVQYDPTFQGGNLSIRAKKIITGTQTISITLNGDSINTVGNYPLLLHSKFNVVYSDQLGCAFHTYYDSPILGYLDVRKFDNSNRIISGTFSFKVTTSTCGTIDGTDGRFDVKF